MKTSYLVSSQGMKYDNVSESNNNMPKNSYINSVIADDASRKLDFLILVIETLQINATDSLLLTARDIGLSEDFTSRVQFWKIFYFRNIFF